MSPELTKLFVQLKEAKEKFTKAKHHKDYIQQHINTRWEFENNLVVGETKLVNKRTEIKVIYAGLTSNVSKSNYRTIKIFKIKTDGTPYSNSCYGGSFSEYEIVGE